MTAVKNSETKCYIFVFTYCRIINNPSKGKTRGSNTALSERLNIYKSVVLKVTKEYSCKGYKEYIFKS